MIFSWLTKMAVVAALCTAASGAAQTTLPWSQRAADAAMKRWPSGHIDGAAGKPAFKYELGTLLAGIDAVYLNTADARYYNYMKSAVDELITPEGAIPTYKPAEYQLDSILMGRQLLRLYGITRNKKYLTAATLLYEQLQKQPRTASGGFWHKERYPDQMWLDGLYMAEPFYAEYAALSHHPEKFADVAHQFALVREHMRDARTGLLYHGWDESRAQRWADKKTGLSPEFWGRAMGWTMMALVDTLDYLPAEDASHRQLVAMLQEESAALLKVQDAKTGLWYQVLDKGGEKGNYLESSASAMIVYSLAKGVRRGYLPESDLAAAEKGWQGLIAKFAVVSGNDVSFAGTVKVGGLGGKPYRDGTYTYYLSEPVVTNDPKGVGPFILAATEIESAQKAKLGRGKTVVMDGWLNSQKMTDAFGEKFLFHYKWKLQADAGFSMLGRIFENYGAQTTVLDAAPTVERLKNAQVYFIVSPDTLAKNPAPHFATAEDAAQLEKWVSKGGVLVILANDAANTDLDGLNRIGTPFGLRFNNVLRKHVEGTKWEMGKVALDGSGPVFHQPHTIYIKDVCTIAKGKGVEPLLREGADLFMARVKHGRGAVIAMADPWLYNEYTDGRKLPASYENYAAGAEFARYILEQAQ